MITCTFENGNTTSLRHVVVHAIVEDEGKLLLVKRTGDLLESGKWSLPGGYLDRDETAGQGVVRELYEKTGTPDGENSKIEWIPIDKLLPMNEFAFDHGESIGLYLKYRNKRFPLPIID